MWYRAEDLPELIVQVKRNDTHATQLELHDWMVGFLNDEAMSPGTRLEYVVLMGLERKTMRNAVLNVGLGAVGPVQLKAFKDFVERIRFSDDIMYCGLMGLLHAAFKKAEAHRALLERQPHWRWTHEVERADAAWVGRMTYTFGRAE